MDMREWLAIRRVKLYENAEHAFANALSQSAMQLSFVKRARVDLQTSLGGRKGAGGVDVAGALAEDDDGILGWQLRGYAAEHGTKGLNTGLFYRRVVGGALAGVNVFADYEDGDDGDFWRWSIGGDVKNRFGEISANHYFAITDAQVVGGKTAYTREGYDVDLALRIPRLEWAKARVGYYEFKGEFGDEDETGLRGGLDLSPGKGVVFGVEYDGEDGSFGGNISYTHTFGETQQEPQRAGEFNPRAHFYDAVRREYSQRISRAESGGGGGFEIVETQAEVRVTSAMAAVTMSVTVTAGAANSVFAFADTVNVGKANGAATIKHQGDAWTLALSTEAAEIAFIGGTVMSVASGRGTFNRTSGGIGEVIINGRAIILLGTHFDFDTNGNNITLREGGLSMAAATGLNIEVADRATVIVNNMSVRCGETVTVTGVNANCNLGGGGKSVLVATITAARLAVRIGRFTLTGNVSNIFASITPGFDVSAPDNGVYAVFINNTVAEVASPDDKVATLHLTDTRGLQQATMVFFTVVVNPVGIGVGFAGDVKTFSPVGAGNVIVGTLTVGGGFDADNIVIAGQSQNGGFALQNASVLVISGDTARTAVVTVRGDDNNGNTPAAFVTQAVTIGDPITRPFCSSGSTCRTFTVTAHNISDMSTPQFTVGSANLRFVEGGQTVQTNDKVLVTLMGGAAAFTVTDEQVRGMLGNAGSITASVIIAAGATQTITADVQITMRVDYGEFHVEVTNTEPFQAVLTRTSTPFAGDNIVMTIRQNLSSRRDLRIISTNDPFYRVGNNFPIVINSARDYTITIVADNDAIRGITVIAPLGAGGDSGPDSALLELQFSPPQFPQVSYLSNTNQPVRLSSFPRRRESPRALGG